MTDAISEIIKAYEYAVEKHPQGFASAHEGYAVLLEEVDELWECIKEGYLPGILLEAAQVGAVALRILVDVCGYDPGIGSRNRLIEQIKQLREHLDELNNIGGVR